MGSERNMGGLQMRVYKGARGNIVGKDMMTVLIVMSFTSIQICHSYSNFILYLCVVYCMPMTSRRNYLNKQQMRENKNTN